METSAALGFGFRCGFLGLLHLEIIQERLTREFNLDLIATAPSVVYRIDADRRRGDRAAQSGRHARPGARSTRSPSRGSAPPSSRPTNTSAAVLKLCQDRRGVQRELSYVGTRAMVVYDLPLNEVVFDFYDRLKSISKGYASFDYQLTDYRDRRPRQDADPGQRRAGRRALDAGPPHPRRDARPRHGARR